MKAPAWLLGAGVALSACTIRMDFARPTGEPLRVVDDPRRAGRVVPVQGDAALDEESFYRMTGDADAVRRFESYRRGGTGLRVAGGIFVGLGAAAVVHGAPFVPMGDADILRGLSAVGAALIGGGTAFAVTGVVLLLLGDARSYDPELELIRDPARMRRQVERYNEALRDR